LNQEAPEAARRAREVVVVGASMLVGGLAGVGGSIVVVRSSERTAPSGWVFAAAVGTAMVVAWLLARMFRGEKAVGACAAGVVTALAMFLWSYSGGE
jgi:alpha-galactosidase/6-phospho-beta-glucosidase family protein